MFVVAACGSFEVDTGKGEDVVAGFVVVSLAGMGAGVSFEGF